jgi:hypothetical protein
MIDTDYGKMLNTQALIFRNPYCRFQAARDSPFIDRKTRD